MRIQRTIVMAVGAALLLSGAAYAQTCTPITSVPTTISNSGVYCLTANLTFTGYGTAITITNNAILIDFNGYRLLNSPPSPSYLNVGIDIGDDKNVTIRNGLISDFNFGILASGRAAVVEDMQFSENDVSVVLYNGEAIFRRNFCRRSISCVTVWGDHAKIVDNDVVGRVIGGNIYNMGVGIDIAGGQHALVQGNRLSRLDNGIYFHNGTSGKFRDTMTANVTVPFTGGTNIGNNN